MDGIVIGCSGATSGTAHPSLPCSEVPRCPFEFFYALTALVQWSFESSSPSLCLSQENTHSLMLSNGQQRQVCR
jgi:hypothetical protein